MTTVDLTPTQALKKFFGFDGFKGDQEAIIQQVLSGGDAFVIMPTGGGKSLCYQLPALMRKGTAIVVSPLIALMKNQVDAVRAVSEDNDVAHFLNSSLNKTETAHVKDCVLRGVTKLLYVAPESLTKEDNIAFLKKATIQFMAIDEAHCISEWGHDFRPEYRRLKSIMQEIAEVPIIALTATATPKVQGDIQKNLGMTDAKLFKASFNRPNLYYEIRPKKEVVKQIISFVRQNTGKSGIIYCLSRKKVEEISETLRVNGISAQGYHAGMDGSHRSRVQDDFLMQRIDVIVATIAFGMGIDKPDVRFVIHHDMPKSLESYYQETGRAGRDGGEGNCVAFYSYKDIEKLEKFLHGKPLAEQEVGMQLLQEVVGYAETSMSRRKYILHYFGEHFDEVNGPGAEMDDNSRYPKEQFEGKDQVVLMLNTVKAFRQMHKGRFVCDVLVGKDSSEIEAYRAKQSEYYGAGKPDDEKFWNAINRQCVVRGLLRKEVESYGTLKITPAGEEFLANPDSFMLIKERDFSDVDGEGVVASAKTGGGIADENLLIQLKDLRLEVSRSKNLPPYVLFQEPSLEEMAFQYPITLEELQRISGVGMGKARKFGKPFVELIAAYVDENDIERSSDMMVKSVVNKSGLKVHIIQNIDRKLPLGDIASAKGKTMDDILDEIEAIVNSGTKVSLNYYIDEMLDPDSQEEIWEYFMETDNPTLVGTYKEFEGDFSEEELRLMHIRFLSEVAN